LHNRNEQFDGAMLLAAAAASAAGGGGIFKDVDADRMQLKIL
jgi:hypothetical protein